jgi:hypothetical protein
MYDIIYNKNKKDIKGIKYDESYYNYSNVFERSHVSKEPIYNQFHSDDFFYLDDKNSSLYFLNMIWWNESHADAHNYEIFKYKILTNFIDFYNKENWYVYYLDYKWITTKDDKWKPEEVLLNIINKDYDVKEN